MVLQPDRLAEVDSRGRLAHFRAALEKLAFQISKIVAVITGAKHNDKIDPCRQALLIPPQDFTQPTFAPVTLDGIADTATGNDTETPDTIHPNSPLQNKRSA